MNNLMLYKIKQISEKAVVIDAHTHAGISFANYVNMNYPYSLSIEDLVLRMNLNNIDYSVVFPLDSSYYYPKPGVGGKVKTTTEFSEFPYAIENRNLFKEIYEVFPEYSDRILPFVMFDPSREVEKQIELFEEINKKYGIFGLKTATTYIQSYIKDLETIGKSILEFAIRNKLPLIIHSSYYKNDPWSQVNDIIDIADKYPELRVCVAHMARFYYPALKRIAELPNCYTDLAAFTIHCKLANINSEAIPEKKYRFPSDYNDPSTVLVNLVSTFPDKIIWGSDTPYNYFYKDYYDSEGRFIKMELKALYNSEVKVLNRLDKQDRERITYYNTVRFLFGI